MPYEVQGVVSRAKGEPVSLESVTVPDPGPGEAVVSVKACGVRHTDPHYREGGINDGFPFLLGHEATGFVEAVGDGVTDLDPGDYVILNWPALDAGAFPEKKLVHSGQCTKVDPAAEPAVAGLLGCGVMAGLGAALNTGAVSSGDSVAVIGCGGVGDAAIAGASLACAKTIVAIDTDDRKLAWAKDFGATHTLNSKGLSEDQVVEAIQEFTDSFGADVVIDAVGRPQTWRQAFLPSRDFPMLIDLYPQGRLPLDKSVTERIALDGVEQGFERMHHGDVLRSVVTW
ncbi:zinc-binding dehydrogenase [Amycolatopsis speibonae]|uniref:Zinc-binding dehydrogenase n=1 Tax=Amycolatopsis speibonae TaxID=1450224 RepID=A0ABV7P159_9PSEU